MQQFVERNDATMSVLQGKLVRDYNKLLQKMPKKQLTEGQERMMDRFTFGEDRNDRMIAGSLTVPFLPVAIGLGEIAIGMVALIPSATQPIPGEAVSFFESARAFSVNILGSGFNTMEKAVPLLILPATVTAISVAVSIYRSLKNRKENKLNYMGSLINFMDDVLAKKEDPTLDFTYTFLGKVDLSQNSQDVNLGIVYYLAYYRKMLEQHELGNVSDVDLDMAYDSMIEYFAELKNYPGASQKYKNSRYLNILIMDLEDRRKAEQAVEGLSVAR